MKPKFIEKVADNIFDENLGFGLWSDGYVFSYSQSNARLSNCGKFPSFCEKIISGKYRAELTVKAAEDYLDMIDTHTWE